MLFLSRSAVPRHASCGGAAHLRSGFDNDIDVICKPPKL